MIWVDTEPGYPVHLERGATRRLTELSQGIARVAIIYPKVLAKHANNLARYIRTELTFIEVPEAELAKSAQELVTVWNRLATAGFTRSDLIIGLGGGATTDLAGFVAATWLRGINWISIPTSILGAVDASVGGKNGINLSAGKNLVGAFWEPIAVLCDLDLISTLPMSQVSAGLAEIIKCGFIKDPQILDLIEQDPADAMNLQGDRLAELITRAIQVKASVVATDLREQTSTTDQIGREALNYGHTLGHAIENNENYSWSHGAAISVGMVWIAEISHRLLGLQAQEVARHIRLLAAVGLPTSYLGNWSALRTAMALDKKTRGSKLRLIGLRSPGEVALLVSPPEDVLAEVFEDVVRSSAL